VIGSKVVHIFDGQLSVYIFCITTSNDVAKALEERPLLRHVLLTDM